VFIDPPYVQDINAIAQIVLGAPGLIAPDGVVIVQGPIQLESPAAPAGFVLERREYGSNALTLYWKAPS
jgi:16S rRNA G966 N2-methylase RsmD